MESSEVHDGDQGQPLEPLPIENVKSTKKTDSHRSEGLADSKEEEKDPWKLLLSQIPEAQRRYFTIGYQEIEKLTHETYALGRLAVISAPDFLTFDFVTKCSTSASVAGRNFRSSVW